MSISDHRLALPSGYRLDHYRLDEVLGKGGFGVTYKAWDETLGQWVAIKELLPDSIATRTDGSTVEAISSQHNESWAWARERFIEEARALAKLKHPNIVTVHRLLEANSTVYMVMEYVQGETYGARLSRIGREQDEKSLMSVINPIVDGLEYLHNQGLVHRDVKPDNILIGPHATPMLVDFGSARAAIGQTVTMTSIVTHGYSPIEQYQTKGKIGPWTDIYAIGAVMYRSITGEKLPVATDRLMEDEFKPLTKRSDLSSFNAKLLAAIDATLCLRTEGRPQNIRSWRSQFPSSEFPPKTTSVKDISLDFPGNNRKSVLQLPSFISSSLMRSISCFLMLVAIISGIVLFLCRPSSDRLVDMGNELVKEKGHETEAIQLYRKAADRGNLRAFNNLGLAFDQGTGVPVDKAEAMQWYKKAADRGFPNSQFLLGLTFLNGDGVPMNVPTALQWLEKAGNQGHLDSLLILGDIYLAGKLVPKDERKAQEWYKKAVDPLRKAADQGKPEQQLTLARLYFTGNGVPKDASQAIALCKAAANGGYADAQFALALSYLSGDGGLEKSTLEAGKWFLAAAQQGHVAAQSRWGRFLLYGIGIQENPPTAIPWLLKAAEAGDSDAQNSLADCYRMGRGVSADAALSARWYRKAAEQGNAGGQYFLAAALQTGSGVTKDITEAYQWLRKASEQGLAEAQNALGNALRFGAGCTKDLPQAVQWYIKAADQDSEFAQYNLGVCYHYAFGVSKDDSKAIGFIKKSAEKGYKEAQAQLGSHYYYAWGTPKNLSEALKWFRKAAAQGQNNAQFMLGYLYYVGEGVPKDYKEAAKWYTDAADQGNAYAQFSLGNLFENGTGVPKLQVEAVAWYRKAAQQGHEEAIRALKRLGLSP